MTNRLLRSVWLLGSILAFTLAVNAQTALTNVRVPFEFAAGGKMLPAGEYTFESPDLSSVLLIRGSAGNSVVVLAVTGTKGSETSTAKLMFERKHGELFLRGVELPDQTVQVAYPFANPPKTTASAALAKTLHQ